MPTVQSIDIIDAEEHYDKIALKGQLYTNETYDLVKNPSLLVVPANSGGINFPSMPTGFIRLRNLSGNEPMYVGGTGDEAPYILANGIFHGYELMGDREKDYPVNNGSILSIVAKHSGQRVNWMAFLNGNDVQLNNIDPDPVDFSPPMFLFSSPGSGSSGIELDMRFPDFINSGYVSLFFNKALSSVSGNFVDDNLSVQISGQGIRLSGIIGLLSGDNTVMTFAPMSGLSGNQVYQILVNGNIEDELEDKLGTDLVIPFTTYSNPGSPVLVSTWPSSGASGIDLTLNSSGGSGGKIWATFDRALFSGNNNNSGNMSLHAVGGVAGWSGAVSVSPSDAKTIVFGPTGVLSGNQNYELILGSGIQEARYQFPQGMEIRIPFTTTINPTGPSIVSSYPASGASGVPFALNGSGGSGYASVTFDKALFSGNANLISGNLSLATIGGVSFSGVISMVSGDPKTMKFKPGLLSGNTTYQVTVGSGIREGTSTFGIPMGNTFTIPFITDANPTAATFLNSFPASGASGIALDLSSSGSSGYLYAHFNKALVSGNTNINSGNISLRISGSSGWSGAQFMSPGDNTTIVFDPASNLSGSKLYEFVIGSGLKELAGNVPLGQTLIIPFITDANPPPPDTTPPWVASFSPALNALGVDVSGTQQFVFNEKVQALSISTNTVGLWQAGTKVSGTLGIDVDQKTVTFTPNQALSGSTVYNIRASGVKDLAGNTQSAASGFSGAFTTLAVDVTPPFVSTINPDRDGIDVAVNVHPQVTYNEALQSASVSTSTVQLYQAGSPVVGSVALAGDNVTITFTPSSNLSGNTIYNLRSSGVKDTNGNVQSAASGYSGAFTTTVLDVTPPFVSSANPIRGFSGSPTNVAPQVVFNETLLASSISNNTVKLFQAGTAVAGAAVLGADNVTVTFTPSAALSGSTVYNMRASGVRDLAGNVQTAASGYSGAFTTAAVDITPPFVSSGDPTRGLSGVAVTIHPMVVYNETLLASSVSTSTIALYQTGSPVAGSVVLGADLRTCTFTPSTSLNNTTVYNLRASGVKDAASNVQTAASGYSGAFTTLSAGQSSTSFYNASDNSSTRILSSTNSSRAGWRFTSASTYLGKKIVKAQVTLQRSSSPFNATGTMTLHQLDSSTGTEKMRLFLNGTTPTLSSFSSSKANYTWELSGTPSVTIAATDVFMLDISGAAGTGDTDNITVFRNSSDVQDGTKTHWVSTDWTPFGNITTTDTSGFDMAGILYEPA
jgi:Bacterial Ig-like domain